jgi:hypothetical protein
MAKVNEFLNSPQSSEYKNTWGSKIHIKNVKKLGLSYAKLRSS